MKKKFLGIICLLYSTIILYVIIFDKIKNYLAPQLQIYIKLSLIPMILIGIVLLLDKKNKYKFKTNDIVLIIPLLFLIFSGDGRLTASFANNRTNFKIEQKVKAKETNETSDLEQNDIQNEIKESKTSFSKAYFEIDDSSYSLLAGYLTYNPKAQDYIGKTIRVKGFVIKNAPFVNEGYFALGKYEISCCAADASFTGFIAKYDTSKIIHNAWYELEGVLKKGIDAEGYEILYIDVINIEKISSTTEEQYVYPCYSYEDGTCDAVKKYNLDI